MVFQCETSLAVIVFRVQVRWIAEKQAAWTVIPLDAIAIIKAFDNRILKPIRKNIKAINRRSECSCWIPASALRRNTKTAPFHIPRKGCLAQEEIPSSPLNIIQWCLVAILPGLKETS